jgi:hypothetical protein
VASFSSSLLQRSVLVPFPFVPLVLSLSSLSFFSAQESASSLRCCDAQVVNGTEEKKWLMDESMIN